MTAVALAAAAGACVGAGGWLVAREAWPAGPDLAALVRAQTAPAAPAAPPLSGRARLGRIARPVMTRWPGIPTAALAVTGTSVELFCAQTALAAFYGLLAPAVLIAIARVGGVTVPLIAVPLFGVGLGALASASPAARIGVRAAQARREFRIALAAYLDLVALERAADAAAADALSRAADVADGWAFRRIRDALAASRLSGIGPWQALSALGVELGVPELADLADIVGLAALDGARILDTLAAKAESMRTATLAEEKTRANAASNRMQIPASLIFYALLLLLLYPLLTGLQ